MDNCIIINIEDKKVNNFIKRNNIEKLFTESSLGLFLDNSNRKLNLVIINNRLYYWSKTLSVLLSIYDNFELPIIDYIILERKRKLDKL